MTTSEFISKYIGVGINYDGAYGDQCVDEYDQYCVEVVGCPVILVNGAVNIWDNYPADYFDKIPNTPDGFPQLGDVMIWGTGIGPFGHVAIVRDGNKNSFNSLDQNWSGIQHCEIVTHNYTAVLGWLRPKQSSAIQPQPLLQTFTDQTKIPANLLGTTEDMEIQAIRGKLGDLVTTQQQLVDCQNKPVITPPVVEPIPTPQQPIPALIEPVQPAISSPIVQGTTMTPPTPIPDIWPTPVPQSFWAKLLAFLHEIIFGS